MREMDAFEQAYKNGYAAGMKAAEEKIVYCKDCALAKEGFCETLECWRGNRRQGCVDANDFCSWGERRSDG